jgi:homopolymeric O-antigen transport system permease protein
MSGIEPMSTTLPVEENRASRLTADSPVGPSSSEAAAPAYCLVIEPQSGWRSIDFRDLWRYRDLFYFLTWRDIKVRYKQTVLGAAWAVLQPVLTMVVFSIFFGRLGGLDQKVDVPYPIFAYAGLLPWVFFSGAVTQSAMSVISSQNLVTKVYFPRLIVPFASVGGGLVDLGISFVVMLVLMVAFGTPVSVCLALAPLLTVITVLAALGVGTLLAALVAAYRDFRYVIPFLVQIWMFASPVAYPLAVVPESWRLWYALNPMVGIISGFRSAFLGEPLAIGPLVISTLASLALFAVGTVYFRRVERRFADVI